MENKSSIFFEELSSFVEAQNQTADFTSYAISDLETQLSQWIAASSFPSTYFQPIIRGLPRQFLRKDINQSKIKPAFCNKHALIRQWLDRPLMTIYSQFLTSDPIHVVLFTWVISDGWGDLFAQFEAARVLLSSFKNIKLTLMTLIEKDRAVPSFEHPFDQHWIPFSGKINRDLVYQAFSHTQLQHLSEADVILEIPTPFPHMQQVLNQLTDFPTYIRLGEHSLSDTAYYHPETKARCMGLHFLEKGIFTKEPSSNPSLDNIHLNNAKLQDLLFASFPDIKTFQQAHSLQIAYTKTYRGLFLYLTALLTSLEDDVRDIDICFFQMQLMIHLIINKFQDPSSLEYPLLKNWNISRIVIYDQKNQASLFISPKGKIVRLINCAPLNHDDFLQLVSLTDRLIGATGDQSVLEAISSGKPFFFDPPGFKRPFLKDLILIAKKKLPEHPILTQFFQLCFKPLEQSSAEWIPEDDLPIFQDCIGIDEVSDLAIAKKLGNLLKNPAIIPAFQALKEHLYHSYPLQPILCGLINRAFLLRQQPELAELEENQIQKFLEGSQSLDETLNGFFDILYPK